MQKRIASFAPLGAVMFLTSNTVLAAPNDFLMGARVAFQKAQDPKQVFCNGIRQLLEAQLKKEGITDTKVIVSAGSQNPDNIMDFDVIYKIADGKKTKYEYSGSYVYKLPAGYVFNAATEKGVWAGSSEQANQPLQNFQHDAYLKTVMPKLQKLAATYYFDLQDNRPVMVSANPEPAAPKPPVLSN